MRTRRASGPARRGTSRRVPSGRSRSAAPASCTSARRAWRTGTRAGRRGSGCRSGPARRRRRCSAVPACPPGGSSTWDRGSGRTSGRRSRSPWRSCRAGCPASRRHPARRGRGSGRDRRSMRWQGPGRGQRREQKRDERGCGEVHAHSSPFLERRLGYTAPRDAGSMMRSFGFVTTPARRPARPARWRRRPVIAPACWRRGTARRRAG